MPSVKIRDNEPFEIALRRFKRTCEKAGVVAEVRSREFYEKPTSIRKREKAAAVKRNINILAVIKQQEVDTREDLDDTAVLAIIDKLAKQRRESISQFSQAGRDDLVAQEELELGFIQKYLPEPLSEAEVQCYV